MESRGWHLAQLVGKSISVVWAGGERAPGGENRAHRPLERSGSCGWHVFLCGEGEEFGVWGSRGYTGGASEAMGAPSGSRLGLSVMGRWTAAEEQQ